jgi:RHH-type proline utilization regulon transcriptional repressor/proline dehydrogenase/delta 1-pyrroline-5-carboxylate dehydrogenase
MRWALDDRAFRVQLFRFVDVFPTLRSSAEVHDCLGEYLSQPGVELPAAVQAGLKVGGMAKSLLAKGVTQQIRAMARSFIAGTDLADALPTIRHLWDSGIGCSIDLLGEAVVSRAEADT